MLPQWVIAALATSAATTPSYMHESVADMLARIRLRTRPTRNFPPTAPSMDGPERTVDRMKIGEVSSQATVDR